MRSSTQLPTVCQHLWSLKLSETAGVRFLTAACPWKWYLFMWRSKKTANGPDVTHPQRPAFTPVRSGFISALSCLCCILCVLPVSIDKKMFQRARRACKRWEQQMIFEYVFPYAFHVDLSGMRSLTQGLRWQWCGCTTVLCLWVFVMMNWKRYAATDSPLCAWLTQVRAGIQSGFWWDPGEIYAWFGLVLKSPGEFLQASGFSWKAHGRDEASRFWANEARYGAVLFSSTKQDMLGQWHMVWCDYPPTTYCPSSLCQGVQPWAGEALSHLACSQTCSGAFRTLLTVRRQ